MLKDNQRFNESIKPNSVFLAELSQKLPEFFTAKKYDDEGNIVEEAKFDIEKFQRALKEQNVDELSSGYQIDFIGKNYAKKQAGERSTTVIVPDNDHNEKSENKESKNLFFTGDNLEVLRHLQQNYVNDVDFIYIDPPYNTGSDGFVYPDKFEYTDEQLKNMFGLNDEELQRMKSIQGKSTHSAWLAFMYPRLYLAKKLLNDTGVIFVSIDDNEQANLKLLMDGLFGEGSFLGEIIWRTATDNNKSQISTEHEYVLVYAKNSATQDYWLAKSENAEKIQKKYDELKIKTDDISEIQKELRKWIKVNKLDLDKVTHYDNVDKRGVYHDGDIANTKVGGYEYEIIHPVTKKAVKIPPKGYRYPETTMRKMIDNDDIVFGTDETTLIKPKKRLENVKDLLRSVIYEDGRTSTKRVDGLVGKGVFENPKSDRILKKFFEFVLTEKKDALILDFFAGSATTADAVMQLNVEDGGSRRYIMAQLPELTKSDSTAYKVGYTSIDQISRARIEKAAVKIQNENPLLTDNQDFGFKHYQVIEANQQALDKIEYDGDMQLNMFDDMITLFSSKKLGVDGNANGFDTILQTYLVSDNYKFDVPIDMRDFGGVQLPYVNNQRIYIITNDWKADNTKALVNAIGTNEIAVQTIAVYGYTMDMESLRELEIAVNQLENKVNLLVRY